MVTPVGVIAPILNEERHLRSAVEAVLDQDYPGPIHIVLALGPSTDSTGDLAAQLADTHSSVEIVANPSGRTPDGLNAALAALPDDVGVVVRIDGHSLLDRNYIATAVALLSETGAVNVGGVMAAEGTTPTEQAIATAMTSTLGVGAARFHTGGNAGEVDTVYLGVFDAAALARVGGFDPRFTRTQDWELNHRLRKQGGRIWFSPDLRVRYRPRPTLRALARQYRDYGRWRRVVARTHPGTLNARYLTPPTLVVGLLGSAVAGVAWRPAWALPAAYLASVGIGGVAIAADQPFAVRLRTPAALATMHVSWGWGFITSPRGLGQPDPR